MSANYLKKVGRLCWLLDDYAMPLKHDFEGGFDEFVALDEQLLSVRASFAWDGPWPLPRIKWAMRASMVHDALYHLMRSGKLSWDRRDWADAVFRDLLLEDGMPGWLAEVCYRVVRAFGGLRKVGRVGVIR